ncbi:hypothetical protein KKG29_00155 [Patescibacteria group bacterium]|nr:hypothetical protein [Patescibacteria group bacterium]MBU3999582.1 hypothetical protein [Patescibacteria group bacterium]MBU4368807.1 hypothetical protein [Patescibacteria group bacterium]
MLKLYHNPRNLKRKTYAQPFIDKNGSCDKVMIMSGNPLSPMVPPNGKETSTHW